MRDQNCHAHRNWITLADWPSTLQSINRVVIFRGVMFVTFQTASFFINRCQTCTIHGLWRKMRYQHDKDKKIPQRFYYFINVGVTGSIAFVNTTSSSQQVNLSWLITVHIYFRKFYYQYLVRNGTEWIQGTYGTHYGGHENMAMGMYITRFTLCYVHIRRPIHSNKIL